MTVYRETLDWLFGLTARGMRFGLENVTGLLHRMGDPQRTFRSVHVGGTNGKGSVCAMVESVLRRSRRTGLYTSPHLIDFTERIRVDGVAISEGQVVALAERIRPLVEEMDKEGMRLTFFEITTAMAFQHFHDSAVEMAVVEVGLGGRLDATNVLLPACSIITGLGIEHTSYLGSDLASIAHEKAGIVKPGVPVYTSEGREEALRVISRRCREEGAPLTVVHPGGVEVMSSGLDGLELRVGENVYHLPLLGRYQATNALLAVLASRRIGAEEEDIAAGLASVEWPARLQVVRSSPRLVVDVTHTAEGAEAVASAVEELFPGRRVLVLGILADKDIEGICRSLGPLADVAIATAPLTGRALGAEGLAHVLEGHCPRVIVGGTVAESLEASHAIAGREDTIIVSGSLYTAGEALTWMRRQ